MIRAEISLDRDGLWEMIENNVEDCITYKIEDENLLTADMVCDVTEFEGRVNDCEAIINNLPDTDGVIELIHEELGSNDVASSADVYDILEEYDFSAHFDYYMESYDVVTMSVIEELRAQVDMLMDERAARIDARLSNRLRRLWARLKGIHWYSPFMPRR